MRRISNFPGDQRVYLSLCQTIPTSSFYAPSVSGRDWQVCALAMVYLMYGLIATCSARSVLSKSMSLDILPQLRRLLTWNVCLPMCDVLCKSENGCSKC